MKRPMGVAVVIVWLYVTCGLAIPVWALGPQPEPPDMKSVIMSKGSSVEKIGPGHFKFILADRKVVEVNGFARTSGGAIAFFRECRIFDAKGQLIDSGMKGALKGRIKPSGQSKAGMIGDTGNVIKMENDLVMLPVTITYEAIKMK